MKKIVMCLTLALVFMTTACAAGSFWDFKKDEGESKVANRIAVFDTNMGEFEIELFEDKTPITTKNFIDLAQEGFYDEVIFHRIIDGFMIQGGDPTGTGMGGPGYTIEDVFGKVIKGMEVVREIGHVKTGPQDRPVHDVVINKITIKDAE